MDMDTTITLTTADTDITQTATTEMSLTALLEEIPTHLTIDILEATAHKQEIREYPDIPTLGTFALQELPTTTEHTAHVPQE